MDSAAALGCHVGPISVPACDRTIAQARWGGVYRQSIVSDSARLRRAAVVEVSCFASDAPMLLLLLARLGWAGKFRPVQFLSLF